MTEYRDDRYLERRDNARLAVIRQVVIYVPSALLLTGLLVAAILALPGSIIAVILLGIGAIAVDVEAYQGTADLLTSRPMTSRGVVDRMWSKGRFLFFGRVRYLLADMRPVEGGRVDPDRKVSRRLFEIGPLAEMELEPGDEVEVVHWPHTNHIVTLEKISSLSSGPRPPGSGDPVDWDGQDNRRRSRGRRRP